MDFVEAAATLGRVPSTRVYFGKQIAATIVSVIEDLGNLTEGISDFTRTYAPLTLNQEWFWVWRLFFLMFFSGAGTIANLFFVTSFLITKKLKQKGNIFFACLGLTDLIITGFVVPPAIVVLLANLDEFNLICKILLVLTEWSTYAYSGFFMFVSIDLYLRVVYLRNHNMELISYPIRNLAVLNMIISLVTAAVGVFFDLDYDYCNRLHTGNYWFRLITSIIYFGIPLSIAGLLLLYTSHFLKTCITRLYQFKRCRPYIREEALVILHLKCYFFFVTAWTPYAVLVNFYPGKSDAIYYSLVWIGVIRSAFTSMYYGAVNNNLRDAFFRLFAYFFCHRNIELIDRESNKAVVSDPLESGIVNINKDESPIPICCITDSPNQMNITDSPNQMNITDNSNQMNITDNSNQMNITDNSNQMNITDNSNQMNITDNSNQMNITDNSDLMIETAL